jgi:hypothetical protein
MNNVYARVPNMWLVHLHFVIFFCLQCFVQSHLHFALYSGKGVGVAMFGKFYDVDGVTC